MALDTTVKTSFSTLTGAPTLTGQVGSLIGIFDAVLVNGINSVTVDSIVVSGGVATVTRSAGIANTVFGSTGSYVGSVFTISGATPAGLNGDKRAVVATITGTSFQFDATGITDQTATGTITIKHASLGWTKVYTATNVAIYQRTDANATGSVMLVNDTTAKYGAVVMYEVSSQSGLSSGIGVTNGTTAYWAKSSTADATARPWFITGDGRGFFMSRAWYAGDSGAQEHTYFGDISPTKINDPYCCIVTGSNTDVTALAGITNNANPSTAADDASLGTCDSAMYRGNTYIQRSYTGTGLVQMIRRTSALLNFSSQGYSSTPNYTTHYSGGIHGGSVPAWFAGTYAATIPCPNPADNGIFCTPYYILEHNQPAIRGTIPGIGFIQGMPSASITPTGTTYAGVGMFAGRLLMLISTRTLSYGSNGGVMYDITGPWVR